MREDVRATAAVAIGFVTGAVMVAYLVLTDPEVRLLYEGKSHRMRNTGWAGVAREVARTTVAELRASFPRMILGED